MSDLKLNRNLRGAMSRSEPQASEGERLRLHYPIFPTAMSVNTIVKIATVSTMPSAAR